MVLRKRLNGVLAEDVIGRLVLSGELEELLFGGGSVKDSSPIEASCLERVDGNRSVGERVVVVSAGLLAVLRIVCRLRPLPDVVAPVEQVFSTVSDGKDVGVVSGDVEGGHRSLEAAFEYDDDMVVIATVFVLLFCSLGPVVSGKGLEVVGDVVVVGIPQYLGVGDEESDTIEASHKNPARFKILSSGNSLTRSLIYYKRSVASARC